MSINIQKITILIDTSIEFPPAAEEDLLRLAAIFQFRSAQEVETVLACSVSATEGGFAGIPSQKRVFGSLTRQDCWGVWGARYLCPTWKCVSFSWFMRFRFGIGDATDERRKDFVCSIRNLTTCSQFIVFTLRPPFKFRFKYCGFVSTAVRLCRHVEKLSGLEVERACEYSSDFLFSHTTLSVYELVSSSEFNKK